MSNALAIAATTATLRNLLLVGVPLLDADLGDLQVTTQPPDLARKGVTSAQVNLFLYQTVINSAWRNMDMPTHVRPGETGSPPLALNLHYLITAYGRGESDSDAIGHCVLGAAMSVLHDHPLLGTSEISDALPGNDLADQFERLRITPLSMSIEEMSKLWTAFQTQYRLSAAYEVTVVLIDSRAPTRSAPPVLRRGEADRGPAVLATVLPSLRQITPPFSQPSARLGEDIILQSEQSLPSDSAARFISLRLGEANELPATRGNRPNQISIHLPDPDDDKDKKKYPDAMSRWAPGFYTVALLVKADGLPPLVSNEAALALAPRITVSADIAKPTVNLTISCKPRIRSGQRVLLVFGDRQLAPDSVATPDVVSEPTKLTFVARDVDAGTYLVRLRVDGVDSIPVLYSGTPPMPSFDPAQQVVVS